MKTETTITEATASARSRASISTISGWAVLSFLLVSISWHLAAPLRGKGAASRDESSKVSQMSLLEPAVRQNVSSDANDSTESKKGTKNKTTVHSEENLTPEAKAERMIVRFEKLAAEYNELQQQLLRDHPELPGLLEYIGNRPGELNEGINHLIDELTLLSNNKEFATAWAKLRALKRPTELLAVLDDATFSTYLRDIWDNAGINKAVTDWIRESDKLAGYKPSLGKRPMSYSELRGALERRLASYQQSFARIVQDANVPQHLLKVLEPMEYFKVQVAEWYVESFHAGRLYDIRREVKRLRDDLGQLFNDNKSDAMRELIKRSSSIYFPDGDNQI
jgi:hypothetical protein